MSNQARLQDNARRYTEEYGGSRGAPRDGAAHLQGLAVCGCCGRRMRVHYKPSARYACIGLKKEFGVRPCAHLDGASVEEFVVQAFFKRLHLPNWMLLKLY